MVHIWHFDVVCDFIFIFDVGNVVILNYVSQTFSLCCIM